jgi:hypothetical protein
MCKHAHVQGDQHTSQRSRVIQSSCLQTFKSPPLQQLCCLPCCCMLLYFNKAAGADSSYSITASEGLLQERTPSKAQCCLVAFHAHLDVMLMLPGSLAGKREQPALVRHVHASRLCCRVALQAHLDVGVTEVVEEGLLVLCIPAGRQAATTVREQKSA